ncbi:ExbD/TolR family protein [Sphingomonas flavalba]|uniref:ExbD/TolR family protein n=1 Tax=Sphingomonas flavalba TaxID=2559804 RepID=UPI00109DC062|nr:biopolymer transporter ExbD [Sphingomonas flavalba]
MAMSGGRDDGAPMMEINTTPLIDVLLVLLIMFIITIPIQTHAVKIDLPANSDQKNPPPVEPDKNQLSIDPRGVVLWNGSPIDLVTLRQYLDRTKVMTPEPELHIQPDPQARYEVVDRVLAVVKRSGVTKMGFVGNEQYAVFGK